MRSGSPKTILPSRSTSFGFSSMNSTPIGLPTFAEVVSSILRAPCAFNLTCTTGAPCEYDWLASTSWSPEAITSRRSKYGRPSFIFASSRPSGARPRRSASAASFSVSTRWNSSVAVAPSTRLACAGSCTPGSCTRIRSTPWRCTTASATPSAFTRLRSVTVFCWIAKSCRSRTAPSESRTLKPCRPSISAGSTINRLDVLPSWINWSPLSSFLMICSARVRSPGSMIATCSSDRSGFDGSATTRTSLRIFASRSCVRRSDSYVDKYWRIAWFKST